MCPLIRKSNCTSLIIFHKLKNLGFLRKLSDKHQLSLHQNVWLVFFKTSIVIKNKERMRKLSQLRHYEENLAPNSMWSRILEIKGCLIKAKNWNKLWILFNWQFKNSYFIIILTNTKMIFWETKMILCKLFSQIIDNLNI